MLSAAAPAAAQVRVGRAVESSAIRAVVPTAGNEARREFSPTTLPLSPDLSAPSVSPDAPAVVFPALTAPAIQTPSSIRAVLPSPSKSNRQAPFSVASAAKAPAPAPSADQAAVDPDALFDGALPVSREVLDRAAARGLSDAVLAQEISASRSSSEAAKRLSALGILGPQEAALAASQDGNFRFLLTRLWRKTAPSIPAPFAVDKTFGVPALKVERGGVTYFVHGVIHGRFGPVRPWAVLSLVGRIAAAGHALYSEQRFPAYYGYTYGRETLDLPSAAGAPAPVVAAAPNHTPATFLPEYAHEWIVALGGALGALAYAILSPSSPQAWVLLAVFGAYVWLKLTGGLAITRWLHRLHAAEARAQGLEDKAAQYDDETKNFIVAKPDLEVLRGLELPQPLGALASDPYSVRSRAIADAVAAAAAAAGASTVHVVTGPLHTHELAWRLANGPRSQIS